MFCLSFVYFTETIRKRNNIRKLIGNNWLSLFRSDHWDHQKPKSVSIYTSIATFKAYTDQHDKILIQFCSPLQSYIANLIISTFGNGLYDSNGKHIEPCNSCLTTHLYSLSIFLSSWPIFGMSVNNTVPSFIISNQCNSPKLWVSSLLLTQRLVPTQHFSQSQCFYHIKILSLYGLNFVVKFTKLL